MDFDGRHTTTTTTTTMDDDEWRTRKLMRLATITTAGLLLGALATTSTTAVRGGATRAMLGGSDARASEGDVALGAALGGAKWNKASLVKARTEKRAWTRKGGRGSGAEVGKGGDYSARAFDDGSRTRSASLYDYSDVMDVPQWMMNSVREKLHRYEGFAYGENGDELVGNVQRAQWRRAHFEARKNHRIESELGSEGDSLTTPVFVISLGDLRTSAPNANIGSTDAQRVEGLVKGLAHAHGTEAVKHNVRLTPGVNVHDWPENENVVQYSLKSILANKRPDMEFSKMPWLSFFASRDKDGHFHDKFAEERHLEHHIGCLFAHLFQYQLAYDSGYPNTFMLESDAWDPALQGLPFSSYDALVRAAPKDYDVIFIDRPIGITLHQPIGQFEDPETGKKMLLYRLKHKNAQAGLSAALISERFYPKFFKHVGGFGADMVDAMLKVELCVDSAFDSEGKLVGLGAGNEPALKCYWALPATMGEQDSAGDFVFASDT